MKFKERPEMFRCQLFCVIFFFSFFTLASDFSIQVTNNTMSGITSLGQFKDFLIFEDTCSKQVCVNIEEGFVPLNNQLKNIGGTVEVEVSEAQINDEILSLIIIKGFGDYYKRVDLVNCIGPGPYGQVFEYSPIPLETPFVIDENSEDGYCLQKGMTNLVVQFVGNPNPENGNTKGFTMGSIFDPNPETPIMKPSLIDSILGKFRQSN